MTEAAVCAAFIICRFIARTTRIVIGSNKPVIQGRCSRCLDYEMLNYMPATRARRRGGADPGRLLPRRQGGHCAGAGVGARPPAGAGITRNAVNADVQVGGAP